MLAEDDRWSKISRLRQWYRYLCSWSCQPSLERSGQEANGNHASRFELVFYSCTGGLANWLCENSGADKAFFCNSGAEANEAAIKVARRHASNRGITVSCSLQKDIVVILL